MKRPLLDAPWTTKHAKHGSSKPARPATRNPTLTQQRLRRNRNHNHK